MSLTNTGPDVNSSKGSRSQAYKGIQAQVDAINAFLPSATGNSGKYLTTDGSTGSWATVAGGGGGGGPSSAVTYDITQVAHGFTVGKVLKMSGTTYALAQADSAANAEVVGIVSAITDADNFTMQMGGRVTGLSGLTAGTEYFLSPSSAGALTATEPTTLNQVSKPLFLAATTTSGYFYNFRGMLITNGASNPAAIGKSLTADGTNTVTTYDYPFSKYFYESRPTGAIAETFPRIFAAATGANLAGGFVQLSAINIPVNTLISSISFLSSGVAAGTPTHQWFCLVDVNRNILAVTSDALTAAWGTNTVKTLNLASAFITTYSGLHYLGVCVTATTPPSIATPQLGNATAWSAAPRLCGATSSGQTIPMTVGATLAGFAGGGGLYAYAYVS
jgi:hypothetical protein